MSDVLEADEHYECVTCGHEWSRAMAAAEGTGLSIVKDSNGNVLRDGDSVTVIKDLKVKGSSTALKAGTKIKRICLVDGMGIMLKAEFLKKA